VLHALDHVVVLVRDLAQAAEGWAAPLGRPPSWRGEHVGAGTANALFRVENTYLELLTPRGRAPVGEGVARALEQRGEGLLALAFACDDATRCAEWLRERGLPAPDPGAGEGVDAETGARRRWRSLMLPPQATRGVPLFVVEHQPGSEALPWREPPGGGAAAAAALDHVVIASPHLEASGALYGETLGLRLALDRSFPQRGLRMLFFRVGGCTLELVGSLSAPPDVAAPDRFGGLAWRVPDAAAARERVATAGFDVSAVRDGARPGSRVCSVRGDPWGVPTLLIEPPPGASRLPRGPDEG
jgi:catechol 2,3-dioxygenase-like lactoylglutathione lyase family enzyme